MTEITRRLAEFSLETTFDQFPDEVISGVKRSALDTLGVMVGGVAVDEAPRILARYAATIAGSGKSTVIAQGTCLTAPYAALVNGTAGDVIGFSDVVAETMNHPSASICAGVWALAEEIGATGKDVISAHAIGLEVAEKIGHGVYPVFHQRGWEPRGLQNTFGTAAACSRLLGLNLQQTMNALGICGAEASGMRAVKGTMSKAYIAGMAARNGVEAALLAQMSYTGPVNVFEARDGVLQTFGEGGDGACIVEKLGNPWEYIDPGVIYKAYPLCTCTHTGIEAALQLKNKHKFNVGDIQAINCSTTAVVLDWLPFLMPENKFQAKYSMPFAVALALLEGDIKIDQVTDEKAHRPDMVELMKKITLDELPEYAEAGYTPSNAPYGCRVMVTLKDGTVYQLRQDRSGWEPTTPPSWEALVQKYRNCTAPVLSVDNIEESIRLFSNLEDVGDFRLLMRLALGDTGSLPEAI
jgi:2-methylcitrate dehydratase PrpD